MTMFSQARVTLIKYIILSNLITFFEIRALEYDVKFRSYLCMGMNRVNLLLEPLFEEERVTALRKKIQQECLAEHKERSALSKEEEYIAFARFRPLSVVIDLSAFETENNS